MYYCQDANMYEKVTSVISWNCPLAMLVYDASKIMLNGKYISFANSCNNLAKYSFKILALTLLLSTVTLSVSLGFICRLRQALL